MTRDPYALSRLTEAGIFGVTCELISATNATLILRDDRDRDIEATDLMSAYGAVNFGHRNPAINPFETAEADIAACFTPPEAIRHAEWLLAALALADYRVLYQVGGSFAVSTALALTQAARPGRVLVVEGGFHGLGIDTRAASGGHMTNALQAGALTRALEHVVATVAPGEYPAGWHDISVFLYEPIEGANGYAPLPIEWLRELEGAARGAGAFTVADEVQSGFYRHGHISASRAAGLQPDILLFSKSMTNGLFPLSAVVYDARLERCQPASRPRLAHTFQTSALGFYAAARVAEYLATTDVGPLVDGVEAGLRRFAEAAADLAVVSAVHVTGPTLSFGLPHGCSARLVTECAERGVLCFTGGVGGQRVRIAPSLTIPQAQLSSALDVVGEVLTDLTERHSLERPAEVSDIDA